MAGMGERIGEKLLGINRRVVFLVVTLVIVVPILIPFGLPLKTSKTTKMFFDAVEKSAREKQVIILSVDYDPNVAPECHPMTIAFLRHCFARGIRPLVLCLYPTQIGLAQDALQTVVNEFEGRGQTLVNGKDYVFLGWKPPPVIPLLGMGDSIRGVFPTDHYGMKTDDLPAMEDVDRYADVDMVCDFSGSETVLWYVGYAQARFGVAVNCGVTGIHVADFYPLIQSGQLLGMLEGMKGAAEYENLVEKEIGVGGRKLANEGMSAQSATHLAIIVFVLLGNVGYFLTRKGRAKLGSDDKKE